jgi:hypothetical protein
MAILVGIRHDGVLRVSQILIEILITRTSLVCRFLHPSQGTVVGIGFWESGFSQTRIENRSVFRTRSDKKHPSCPGMGV